MSNQEKTYEVVVKGSWLSYSATYINGELQPKGYFVDTPMYTLTGKFYLDAWQASAIYHALDFLDLPLNLLHKAGDIICANMKRFRKLPVKEYERFLLCILSPLY
jgi:hypothetical protein